MTGLTLSLDLGDPKPVAYWRVWCVHRTVPCALYRRMRREPKCCPTCGGEVIAVPIRSER